jgi:hypothetical protein
MLNQQNRRTKTNLPRYQGLPHATPPLQGEVTLEAIGKLFDMKMIPLNESLARIYADLKQFKKYVRAELNSIGFKITHVLP